jgi:hypothetical protein
MLALTAPLSLPLSRASVEVPVPLETCWVMWDDRERIPQWMPWIKSVKVGAREPIEPSSSAALATASSCYAANLQPTSTRLLHPVVPSCAVYTGATRRAYPRSFGIHT